MPNPVVHFEIQSVEPEKSRDFFREVFGWQIVLATEMEYGLVNTGAETGINGGIEASPTGENQVMIYIEVDDIQGYLDRAVAAGAGVVMPVTSIPGAVTFAVFSDPAGVAVGIVDSETPPAE